MIKVEFDFFGADGQHYEPTHIGNQTQLPSEAITVLLASEIVMHNLGGLIKDSKVIQTKFDHSRNTLYITLREVTQPIHHLT